jgi:hypothetical protein
MLHLQDVVVCCFATADNFDATNLKYLIKALQPLQYSCCCGEGSTAAAVVKAVQLLLW